MRKQTAVNIITECAHRYEENLLNNSLLFIYTNKSMLASYLEVGFSASNFLNLTGVSVSNSMAENGNPASDFFAHCIAHRLKADDFEFAADGTTELKLSVLPAMMEKNLNAKSVEVCDQGCLLLYTGNLTGRGKGCMRLVEGSNNHLMVQNAFLVENVRSKTHNRYRIIAAYRKNKCDKLYKECVYLNDKVDWRRIHYPDRFTYLQKPPVYDEKQADGNNCCWNLT